MSLWIILVVGLPRALAVDLEPGALIRAPSAGQCALTVSGLNESTDFDGSILYSVIFHLKKDEGLDRGNLNCCFSAQAVASMRSLNTTDPLSYTLRELGPTPGTPKKHDVECVIYDSGAVAVNTTGFWAGATPSLEPLPPAPPPPPSCDDYELDTCPLGECFVTNGSCGDPPIHCGSNTYGDEGALCVHIHVNSSRHGEWHFVDFQSNDTKVVTAFPKTFKTDAWFSYSDGEYFDPIPPQLPLRPWSACIFYASNCTTCANASDYDEIEVCLSLDTMFHGSVLQTDSLEQAAKWANNDPFVFETYVTDKVQRSNTESFV